ncbi:butyrophilin-like protein 8 [Haplochromis burtoni]|nr:butyrophilin-like protein 8 [Haplochromis burtoni]
MKVCVYENGSDRPDKQDDHYRGRTEMNTDLLTTGDLGLTLRQPTVKDSGRYACEVNSKEAWRYKRVWLTVKGTDQVQDPAEDNKAFEMTPLMDQLSLTGL